jgi:hypothetical protein
MNDLPLGYCYGCCKRKQITKDHIIPQAVGGKLKAPLCTECSNNIQPIDLEVTRNLQQIATLLNVKRERKENKPFKVKQVKSGTEFYIDSKTGRRAKPEIKHDENGLPIPIVKAGSKKELNQILEGIKKKYGEFAQNIETISEPISIGEIEYDNSVGGRLFMRSVAKSAYLFLAVRLPKEKVFSNTFTSIRDFIFDDNGESLTSFNFINTKFMDDGRRHLHGIAVHFDCKNRNIVAYVQYFGTFRFSVLLARTFPWEISIADLKYCIDPVTGNEVPLKTKFSLPDVTIQETLHPAQSTKLVDVEIENGLKRLESYCNSISKTNVEFINPQNFPSLPS